MHVFLSYSRRDAAFVGRLANDLATRGIEPWLDTEDLPTEDEDRWRRSVVQGIRESDAIILVLSPDSVASASVERELTIAAEMTRRIIPISHRPSALSDGVMFELAGLQRTDFVDQPYDIALDQLVQRIHAVPAEVESVRNAKVDHNPGSEAERQVDGRWLVVAAVVLLIGFALAGIGLLRNEDARIATPTATERAGVTAQPTGGVVPGGSAPGATERQTLIPWDVASATLERRDGTSASVKASSVGLACSTGNLQFKNGQTISLEIVESIRFDAINLDNASADGVVKLLNGQELTDPIYTWNCPVHGTTELGPIDIPLADIQRVDFSRDAASMPEGTAQPTGGVVPGGSAPGATERQTLIPWDVASATLERRDGTSASVKASSVGLACSTGNLQFKNGQTISLEIVESIRFDAINLDNASADGVVKLLNGQELTDPIYTWNCPVHGTTELGPIDIPLADIQRVDFSR